MKTILSLIILALTLSADAAFYQFNRYTTNFDGTLINGVNQTNIPGSALQSPLNLAQLNSANANLTNVIFQSLTANTMIGLNGSKAAVTVTLVGATFDGTTLTVTGGGGGSGFPLTNDVSLGGYSETNGNNLTITGAVQSASSKTTGAGANGVDMLLASNSISILTGGVINGNGSGLTNLPTSAVVTPTITQTNFISGRAYTNATGRTQTILSGVDINAAVVNGAANMWIQCDPNGGVDWSITNRMQYGTTVTTLADQFLWPMMAFVGPGWSYVWTNASTGAGNSTSLRSATGFIKQD